MKRSKHVPPVVAPVWHDDDDSTHDIARAGHRAARWQQIAHEELSSLLRDEVREPALAGIVVTAVEPSADLKHLKVRYVTPPDRAPRDVERALSRAAPFLRARLVETLDAKYAPQLRFVVDHDPPPPPPEEDRS